MIGRTMNDLLEMNVDRIGRDAFQGINYPNISLERLIETRKISVKAVYDLDEIQTGHLPPNTSQKLTAWANMPR
jgi:hypothetical protein